MQQSILDKTELIINKVKQSGDYKVQSINNNIQNTDPTWLVGNLGQCPAFFTEDQMDSDNLQYIP